MLASAEIATLVRHWLADFDGPVICDPVMAASSGGSLMAADDLAATRALLPHVSLITPNTGEAATLTGQTIADLADAEAAAPALLNQGARAVLITGGHLLRDSAYCYDYFASPDQSYWLRGEWVVSNHNHGTGCTLAAAITAALALGYDMADAVVLGKMVVT